MQPGQTINPGDKSDDDNQPPADLPPVEPSSDSQELKLDHKPPEEPQPPQTNQPVPLKPPQTEQNPENTTVPASSSTPPLTTESRAQWAPGPSAEPPQPSGQPADVQWTASEFIDHQKSGGWYVAVITGGVVLAGLLYLVTRDIVSVVVVTIAAVLFSVIGSRKPRTLSYNISPDGIIIDNKLYPFTDIKSFSVTEEGAIRSIQLMPLKRFMPSLSMYYPPEQEETIVNSLANYIPHEERRSDPVDRLMKRLRF